MKDTALTVAAAGLYHLCILPAKAAGRLLGRDPLRLRKPADASTYWQPKATSGGLECYFSPGSGRTDGARPASPRYLPLFYALARLAAPRHDPAGATETATSFAAREQGIPDEIYTLW